MPELPEVERAAQRLRAAILGRTIVGARATHPALRRTFDDPAARRVVGRRVERVDRRGKHQLLRLDDGSVLHVHFRMSGDWLVGPSSAPSARYARLELELDDGMRVSLIDPRALATVRRHDDGSALPVLGPEADGSLDAAVLATALASRRVPIKLALLDQSVIAGLGNIYVVEALWRARIDPRTRSSALARVRVRRLRDAIVDTMREAHERPGRYSSGEGAPLEVYDREGEACRRCGRTIRRIVQAGRSTYYCPACQR